MEKKRLLELAGIEEAHAVRINWDAYNEIHNLMPRASIMQGEEKTLSEGEVADINAYLKDMLAKAKELDKKFSEAKQRYIALGRKQLRK